MTLTSLSSNDLKTIARLLEAKHTLMARLSDVDRQLAAYEPGASQPATPGRLRTKARGPRRQPRGAFKQAVLDLIKRRGQPGITVREIAAALGVKANRIHTWFYNTGRGVPQIRKIADATYRWQA